MNPSSGNNLTTAEDEFGIRRYTQQELSVLYRVSSRTFRRWLGDLPIGRRIGHFYNVDQVKAIVEKLGTP